MQTHHLENPSRLVLAFHLGQWFSDFHVLVSGFFTVLEVFTRYDHQTLCPSLPKAVSGFPLVFHVLAVAYLLLDDSAVLLFLDFVHAVMHMTDAETHSRGSRIRISVNDQIVEELDEVVFDFGRDGGYHMARKNMGIFTVIG